MREGKLQMTDHFDREIKIPFVNLTGVLTAVNREAKLVLPLDYYHVTKYTFNDAVKYTIINKITGWSIATVTMNE